MAFLTPQLLPVLPEMFLLAMACIILLLTLFYKPQFAELPYFLTQATLLGSILLLVYVGKFVPVRVFDGAFILDGQAILLKLLVYTSTFFVFVYSRTYIIEKKIPFREYAVLTLFVLLGMSALISAGNLLTLYLGLELLSLPLYGMIAFQRENAEATEAAFKYFLLGAIASAFLLYGFSLLYGATASLDLTALAAISHPASNTLYIIGLVFVIAAVLFKLGLVPFHMWVPDVYAGAPNSLVLFLSSTVKFAAFALLLRLFLGVFSISQPVWQHAIIVVALLSIGLGNITALVQTNIRRLLAYSSIAHMGFVLLAVLSGAPFAYGAAFFYLIIYVLTALGAFGLLTVMSQQGIEIKSLKDLNGLHQRSPWLAFLWLLLLFSMAGIPPTAGFFAKLIVLESLISMHFVWLASVVILFSVIGAYYYIRVVKHIYFEQPETSKHVNFGVNAGQHILLTVNALLILAFGILPTGLFYTCLQVLR